MYLCSNFKTFHRSTLEVRISSCAVRHNPHSVIIIMTTLILYAGCNIISTTKNLVQKTKNLVVSSDMAKKLYIPVTKRTVINFLKQQYLQITGKLYNLLHKAEMLSVCPSVCLSVRPHLMSHRYLGYFGLDRLRTWFV